MSKLTSLTVAIFALTAATQSAVADDHELCPTPAETLSDAYKAAVRIDTIREYKTGELFKIAANGKPQLTKTLYDEFPGVGSGVIVGKSNNLTLVLTNAHVVENTKTINVKTNAQNPKTYNADIINMGGTEDIAILAIQSDETLPCVKYTHISTDIGTNTHFIGNPLGNHFTERHGTIQFSGDYIGLRAPTYLGDSGSTAFNSKGHPIALIKGIRAPKGSYSGDTAIAIPPGPIIEMIEDAKQRIEGNTFTSKSGAPIPL